MRQVSRWIADDGTEFITPDQAIAHDKLCVEIAAIMSRLVSAEISGPGFIQQDPVAVLNVQHSLVMIFERLFPRMVDAHTEFARNATRPAGMTLIGRYMDDCAPGPLNTAWRRIMRMDSKFREYEQPYYAIQADKRIGNA
jgi:hypothetical protein